MLPPFLTLYGIRRGRSWPLRVQEARKIDPAPVPRVECRRVAQAFVENVFLVAVRVLAALFLFIAMIGVMLIYGIIAGGLSLASWARGHGMNQNMERRSGDHNG